MFKNLRYLSIILEAGVKIAGTFFIIVARLLNKKNDFPTKSLKSLTKFPSDVLFLIKACKFKLAELISPR